jgi:hypothetical protein
MDPSSDSANQGRRDGCIEGGSLKKSNVPREAASRDDITDGERRRSGRRSLIADTQTNVNPVEDESQLPSTDVSDLKDSHADQNGESPPSTPSKAIWSLSL